MANFFSTRATKGLIKIGNIYCPENGDFPAYEKIAGTWKLNDLAANVPEDDFNSLNLVLAIFSFLPKFILVWLVGLFQQAQYNPSDGIIPSTLRQLNIGLRGLCYSTYYSEFHNPQYKGKKPLEIIDYKLNRVTE